LGFFLRKILGGGGFFIKPALNGRAPPLPNGNSWFKKSTNNSLLASSPNSFLKPKSV
jgi:hypothetical protein